MLTAYSTFNMVDYLNDPKQGLQPEDQVKLVEYIYNAHCEPTMYFYQPSAPDNQRFEDFMFKPGEGILPMNNFVDPTTLQPTTDFDAAFEAYMQSTDRPDNYSTRGFLTSKGWAFNDIELAETLDTYVEPIIYGCIDWLMYNSSTGLFDQAFMETICDYYDFKAAAITNADWYRVEGGMSNLTDAMYKVATNQGAGVTLNTSVTNMSRNGGKVDVTSLNTQNGTSSTDSYDAVFNTTTFGALQRMDLSGLDLNQNQLIGIRALSYDRATKVAIKFSQPWWKAIMPEPAPHDPPYPNYTFGGVSSTDLPVSNVVYPSWDDGDDTAHTIIVSYSWAQDATRMASLVADQNVEKQDKSDPLIQLIFANLAKLWASVPGAENLMSTLNTTYQTHHAFAWSHDPHATGGFALFGPGQFSNMYEQFTKPLCGGKVMICGEAVSAHHAWISGALDSAYNAVITWLECNENTQGQVALKNSAVGGGQGEHPAEVDETLVYWNAKLRDVHLGEEVSRSDSKVLGK